MNSSIEKKACKAVYDRRTGAAEVSKSRRIDYVVCGVIHLDRVGKKGTGFSLSQVFIRGCTHLPGSLVSFSMP
jgi:hypothetical protein